MKVWKRCLAAILAFMIFTTSVNFSEAADIYNTDNSRWISSDAEVVAESYGLDREILDVLYNPAINGGMKYDILAPYSNGTAGRKDLIAVDYKNKIVYAKELNADGHVWFPIPYVLNAEGDVCEEIEFKWETCYYNNEEYDAYGAFTYDGNSYSLTITYQMALQIHEEEQQRIVQIPAILGRTAKNLEVDLLNSLRDVKTFSDMIPAMNKMLDITYTQEVAQPVTVSTTEEKENSATEITQDTVVTLGEETSKEVEMVTVTVPLLDPEEDADAIASIKALYEEYTANDNELVYYKMGEDYRVNYGAEVLGYTFEKGQELYQQSAALYEHVLCLMENEHLRNAVSRLKDLDPELHEELSGLQKTLKSMYGTAARPGEIRELADSENWKILDESVRAGIFAPEGSYTKEDFAALEDAVYKLKKNEYVAPNVMGGVLLAARYPFTYDITYYNVEVLIAGQAVEGKPGEESYVGLESRHVSVALLEGSTREDVLQAIENSGIEAETLAAWNAEWPDAAVNVNNYERVVNNIPSNLYSDIFCDIYYSPKQYKVKTDFMGKITAPYGYRFELPAYGDGESVYTYIETDENGKQIDWYEGSAYKVTKSAELSQKVVSKDKVSYRVYDLLVDDVQYSMDPEAKLILKNSALNSPTLNMKMPDASVIGAVEYVDGTYRIHAQKFAAGIVGMYWEPEYAKVMKENDLVQEVAFEGEDAAWTNGDFTHVDVTYKLHIDKVKGNWFNRPYEEEEVLDALNLPHTLVTETAEANQLLCGGKEITVKSVYEQFKDLMYKLENNSVIPMTLKQALGMISNYLQTNNAKNAVKKVLNAEEAGGGWNAAKDELALYYYMQQCEASNWSLSDYYKSGRYLNIKKQAALMRDCLNAITQDPGFVESAMVPENYKQMLRDIIPLVSVLADEIEGPNKALNVKDNNFSSLINQLLALEGKTSAVDSSNGIYARTSIRRNGENTGTISVTVNIEGKVPQTKYISFDLEASNEVGKYHILTKDEENKIHEYLAELTDRFGMTEEEFRYYDRDYVNGLEEGAVVYENTAVVMEYRPKQYYVTIAGVKTEEYCAVMKYNGDYCIELPPYSKVPNREESYYIYHINGEKIRAYNGYGATYWFTQEDLDTLFDETGHYTISREVVKVENLHIDMKPTEEKSDKIISYYPDWNNQVIVVDAVSAGLLVSEFRQSFEYQGKDGQEVMTYVVNENREQTQYLSNGSYISFEIEGEDSEVTTAMCSIVILGDVNKDGLVNERDFNQMESVFFAEDTLKDDWETLAGDLNLNGYSCDSNDVLRLIQKYKADSKYQSII